ncbi:hypothetical protein ACFYKX_12935 [Cytobacillus sp. FJAT-54145]|uniref:Uncharacterized protein n=1 Tax=Cytobacillus spartinae TaxID=3299023 RepID=A0ABW6KBE0_9BACI
MGSFKNISIGKRLLLGFIVFVIFISVNYYLYLFKPKNSIDLYQSISFADNFEDAQGLMLEGYEANFKEEDYEYMKSLDTSANSVRQFALFEYDEKSYLVMTSPGTQGIKKLKILAVEELPTEIRDYFLEISP